MEERRCETLGVVFSEELFVSSDWLVEQISWQLLSLF